MLKNEIFYLLSLRWQNWIERKSMLTYLLRSTPFSSLYPMTTSFCCRPVKGYFILRRNMHVSDTYLRHFRSMLRNNGYCLGPPWLVHQPQNLWKTKRIQHLWLSLYQPWSGAAEWWVAPPSGETLWRNDQRGKDGKNRGIAFKAGTK